MIRELKTWVYQCQLCREFSPPIMSVREPDELPAGWQRTLENHCSDWRCCSKEQIDRCPDCAGKSK